MDEQNRQPATPLRTLVFAVSESCPGATETVTETGSLNPSPSADHPVLRVSFGIPHWIHRIKGVTPICPSRRLPDALG